MNYMDQLQDEWIEKTFGSNQYGEDPEDEYEEEDDDEELDFDFEIENNFEVLQQERAE